jgi:hypothetical protein
VSIKVFDFIISTSACILDVLTYGVGAVEDLECRMCLERIANGAPSFVIHIEAIKPKTKFNESSISTDSVRNCKNLLVDYVKVLGKVLPEVFQTTVSA